jgi:hypothetical protein
MWCKLLAMSLMTTTCIASGNEVEVLNKNHHPKQVEITELNVNWASTSPMEFLYLLENHPAPVLHLGLPSPKGWLKHEHIDELVRVIDSEQPTAILCWVISPHIPPAKAKSTLGSEAAIMVECFRSGSQYPRTCSNLAVVDKEVLKQWWRDQVTNKMVPKE